MKKNEKQKSKKIPSKIGIVFFRLILLLALIGSGYFIYQISLLGPIEPVIRYITMGILILIDLFVIWKFIRMVNLKKYSNLKLFMFGLFMYFIATVLLGFCIQYFYSKLDNLNKDYIIYSSSLVTMKDSDIDNIEECHDLNIGIINDTTSIEGYIIPQDIITENKLNEKNTLKEYEDFASMLMDLSKGEIDAIFLSSNYTTNFQSIPGFEDIANTTKVIISKEKEMKNADASIDNDKKSSVTEPFSILLMGVDSEINGMNKNAAFNGDSLVLVTFNPKTLNATMMSIPRDSYVPIACFANQKENKITHAAWYGADCMIKTIENFTGISIDYYAKVNFKAVVSLVDALGGVDVDVEYSFCEQNSDRKFGNDTVYVKKGFQTLNGEQALAYARNRHTWPQYCSKEWNQGERSDIIRGQHQQAVIEALLTKLKDVRSVDKLMELFDLVSSNLDTNMSTNEILSFYNVGKDILSKGINEDGNVISIQKLFLKTTGQMIYDESMKLVLSDQIINQGSLDDVVTAMKVNLEMMEPEMVKTFTFSINEPYEETLIGNGKYPATKLYNLLPNFVGKTKSYAESWGKQNGVKIVFANDGNGTIISQNYPTSKRIDLIPNKTVTLTVGGGNSSSGGESTTKINCSTDPDNSACIMPNFVGKTKSSVNSWTSKLEGINIKYVEMEVSNCELIGKQCKVGTIIEQDFGAGKSIQNKKDFKLTIIVEDKNQKPKPTPSPSPTPKPTEKPKPTDDPEEEN